VVLDEVTKKSVVKVVNANDRLMLVKLKGNPVNIVVIAVYMPTSTHSEQEVDDVYDMIEELMDNERA